MNTDNKAINIFTNKNFYIVFIPLILILAFIFTFYKEKIKMILNYILSEKTNKSN